MKKVISALIVLVILTGSATAQNKTMRSSTPLHLSFGLDGGAPLGDNANVSAFVVGGDFQLQYNFSQNFGLTVSGGIDARLNKGGVVNTIYYAPLLGGLRYYFTNRIFISEQAGYSISLTKGWGPGFTNVAGLGFKLSNNSDVLLGYKGLYYSGSDAPNFNTLALRLAYNFGK